MIVSAQIVILLCIASISASTNTASEADSLRGSLNILESVLRKQIKSIINVSSVDFDMIRDITKLYHHWESFSKEVENFKEGSEEHTRYMSIKVVLSKLISDACKVFNMGGLNKCSPKLKLLKLLIDLLQSVRDSRIILQKKYSGSLISNIRILEDVLSEIVCDKDLPSEIVDVIISAQPTYISIPQCE